MGGDREIRREKVHPHGTTQNQWLMQPQTMEQLMAILAERDAAIQERNLALSEKKAVLAQRDLAILERDAAIVERDNALLERDNVIATIRYRGNSMNSCNWGKRKENA